MDGNSFFDPTGRRLVNFPVTQAKTSISAISNNPKIIYISLTGGFEGSGNDKTDSLKKGDNETGDIFLEIKKFTESKGMIFKGEFITPGWMTSSSIYTTYQFIEKNYNIGDKIIIYGYSNGGRSAMDIVHYLGNKNIKVDLLITVDSTDRHFRNLTVIDVVPINVNHHANYYQTWACGIVKCSIGQPHFAISPEQSVVINTELTEDSVKDQPEFLENPHRYLEKIFKDKIIRDIKNAI